MFSMMEVVGDGSAGSLTIQLGDASNGINLIDVSGLDPVKATLTSSSFAAQDGAIYQSSRRDVRNITMKLGIEVAGTSSTVREVRSNIFKIFRPETQVLMKFYDDETTDFVSDGFQIIGRVESCEPPSSTRFTQDQEVDISVMCFSPDFYDPAVVTVTGMTTADTAATTFNYVGTTETGLTFTINVNRSVSEFQIYYVDGDGNTWTMTIVGTFVTGDAITIVTTPGSKTANLLRAGVTTSILYAISPQSTWMQLAPGTNTLQVVASGAAIPVTVSYMKLFGEV